MDQEKRQQLHDLLTRIPREYTYHIIKYAAEEEGVTPLEITLQDASKVIENKGIDFAISQIIFSIAYGLADRLIFDLLGLPESEIIIRLETMAKGQNNENDKNISMIYEDQGRSQKEKDDVFKALINTYLRRGLKLVTADKGGELKPDLQREEQRLASSASWDDLINNTFKSIILNTLFKEIDDLKTYLETEVKKQEYHGMSVDGLIDGYLDGNAEVKDLFIKALRAAKTTKAQQEGREKRRHLKDKATEQGAVMDIKGGNYPLFSRQELRNAMTPERICKMGTLDRGYIDEETGYIDKYYFDEGELINLKASEISAKPFLLLNAILANSIENVKEEFIESAKVTFYVQGVINTMQIDPRTYLTDPKGDERRIDRKTAAVLFLENLFKPLQDYVGMTDNGSRYSVFNYVSYDASADTMTIQSPYLYQLFTKTQGAYFDRLDRKEDARQLGKKPKKEDLTPLEINAYFKQKAITEDETVFEIAKDIIDTILNAGGSTKQIKTMKVTYTTIINRCPKLKEQLADIYDDDKRPAQTNDGKKVNKTAQYNSVLRKFRGAIKLILDPGKCDFLKDYELISISPAKEIRSKDGAFITWELTPPTKSTIKDKLIIRYKRREKTE